MSFASVFALLLSTLAPAGASNLPPRFHGHFVRASEAIDHDYPLDFTIDESALIMTRATPTGRVWKVAYAPAWIQNLGGACFGVRTAPDEETLEFTLCFPSRLRLSRSVKMTNQAEGSALTFVKTMTLPARDFDQTGFAAAPADAIGPAINVGRERRILLEGSIPARLAAVDRIGESLRDQSEAEILVRHYLLALGLQNAPAVRARVLAQFTRDARVRSAVPLIEPWLGGRADPELTRAAIRAAGALATEAKEFLTPRLAVHATFGTSNLATIHAAADGLISPAAFRLIRPLDTAPTPRSRAWSKRDHERLVTMLGTFAQLKGPSIELRRAAARAAAESSFIGDFDELICERILIGDIRFPQPLPAPEANDD